MKCDMNLARIILLRIEKSLEMEALSNEVLDHAD